MKIRACLVVVFALFCQSVSARPEFLTQWNTTYPASNSDDAACQLCHTRANGGQPWNKYGWDIRGIYLVLVQTMTQEQALDEAFSLSQSQNSDGDPEANTNLEEINQNTQPGWTQGENNTHFFADGSTVSNNLPPLDLPGGIFIDPGSPATPTPVNDPNPGSIPSGDIVINFETLVSDLSAPVLAQRLPGENNLYIVEQSGTIKRVDLSDNSDALYLDFRASTGLTQLVFTGDERGLLGFAFHPGFNGVSNAKIYTYTSESVNGSADFSTMPMNVQANHQSVITEWQVVGHASSNPSLSNRRELMRIDQPQGNHNGGMIEFGPDGYLYISFGDGGGSNDVGAGHGDNGNGRDSLNPLGAILRIDVDGNNSANGEYGIPFNNPFVEVGDPRLNEIFAFGFRNPYRFSIQDKGAGEFDLYVGDVGQRDIEEINRIPHNGGGGNYGWNYKEGSFFFYNDVAVCGPSRVCVSPDPPQGVALPSLIDPIVEYDHDEGNSVIGGYVYGSSAIEGLSGRYVFGDYQGSRGSGRLFYLDAEDQLREFRYQQSPNMSITGFGRDNNGELYVVGLDSNFNGVLKKLVPGVIEELCVPVRATNGKIAMVCL